MSKQIRIELNTKSINNGIKELRRYKEWVLEKEEELRKRLADYGAYIAKITFTGATYDGNNDVSVRVDDTGSVAVIYVEGKSVAFIEFGSGARYGYGHPQAGEFGVGPGTWSDGPNGKGYWNNPEGWWYGGHRSWGNPPAKAMVHTDVFALWAYHLFDTFTHLACRFIGEGEFQN